ncbi:MAG TPA: hypothetical protein PLZ73_04970 [bacterium]|nr:hypothetical protein [bacterium]
MKILAMSLVTLSGLSCSLVSRAADFDGDSRDDVAVFRPASGLWAVQGVTRAYFGGSGDEPRPGDYDGDGIADIAIFRPAVGLWAVRGFTRTYFGGSTDTPLAAGGGQRTYDYVVKPGDGVDLVAALESDTYRSVFIPDGTYSVGTPINITNVCRVVGESEKHTKIDFTDDAYLSIEADRCQVENLYLYDGGDAQHGCIHIPGTDHVTITNCYISGPATMYGLRFTTGTDYLAVASCYASVYGTGYYGEGSGSCTFSDCQAYHCLSSGFAGCFKLSGCEAVSCSPAGFTMCLELSSCTVLGSEGETDYGFSGCENLSSCIAVEVDSMAFSSCYMISACRAYGSGISDYGFHSCQYISSSTATNCTVSAWESCSYKDSDSCN